VTEITIDYLGVKSESRLKLLLLMAMLYCSLNLVGAALAYKLVIIGPGLAPGGIFVLPIVMLIEDVLAEIFGYKMARLLLWMLLLTTVLFCLTTYLIVHAPSPTNTGQEDYLFVFGPIIKSGPTAVLAIAVGRFINIYILSKFKILTHGKLFWLRCVIATAFGSVGSLLIYFLIVFWSRENILGIEKLVVTDFFVRLIYVMIGGIPVTFIVNLIKRKMNIDVFDYQTNFNPFKISLQD
jgi:queuosine precursor transporter